MLPARQTPVDYEDLLGQDGGLDSGGQRKPALGLRQFCGAVNLKKGLVITHGESLTHFLRVMEGTLPIAFFLALEGISHYWKEENRKGVDSFYNHH